MLCLGFTNKKYIYNLQPSTEDEDPADALARAFDSSKIKEHLARQPGGGSAAAAAAAGGDETDDDGEEDGGDDADMQEGEEEDDADQMVAGDDYDEEAAAMGGAVLGDEFAPECDDSVGQFAAHGQPVFSVAVHGNLVATGGEDEAGYLWRLDTRETVARLDGHTDSVVAVGFSADGAHVATAAMDGAIRVWKAATAALVCELNCGDDLACFAWHPKANFLVAGTASGAAYMFDVPGGNMTFFGGHQAPLTCLAWAPDGRTFVTGSEEGSLISWSPKTAQPLVQLDAKTHTFHQAGITAVAYAPDNTLVVSGAQDGSVVLVQIKAGKVVGTLPGAQDSIESIAVSAGDPQLVAVGCLDGAVRVYDPSRLLLRYACMHDAGIVALRWLPARPFFVSASLDGTVRVWDARAGECKAVMQGHTRQLLALALSDDAALAISTSDDGRALVYALPPL